MPAPDLFRLDLPDDKPTTSDTPDSADSADVVVQFPGADMLPVEANQAPTRRPATLERLRFQPSVERFAAGWRAAWIGDGVLGMRPRPVADLARQFWTAPPPYIQDALILRIPYALYGVLAVPISAAAHLLLLLISYPSLLAGALALALFIHLFL